MMTTITNFEVVTSNLPIGILGTGAFFIGSNNLSNMEMVLNVGGITRTHFVTMDKTNVLAQTVQYV
jgi:hypothetical protein